jgi:hypothetical protein
MTELCVLLVTDSVLILKKMEITGSKNDHEYSSPKSVK